MSADPELRAYLERFRRRLKTIIALQSEGKDASEELEALRAEGRLYLDDGTYMQKDPDGQWQVVRRGKSDG